MLVLVVVVAAVGFFATGWNPISTNQQNATSTPQELSSYASDHLGISFKYPPNYIMTTRHEGNAERQWHALVLMDAIAAANIPEGGEGPTAITIQDIPNPEGYDLDTWVRGDARSNFKLSSGGPGALGSRTVEGLPALMYQHSGLYENDAVVVAANGKIYLLSVSRLTRDDQIRKDFEALLDTVSFVPVTDTTE